MRVTPVMVWNEGAALVLLDCPDGTCLDVSLLTANITSPLPWLEAESLSKRR